MIDTKKNITKYSLADVVQAVKEALQPTAGHSPMGPVTDEPSKVVVPVVPPPIIPAPKRDVVSASMLMSGVAGPWSNWKTSTGHDVTQQVVDEVTSSGQGDEPKFFKK